MSVFLYVKNSVHWDRCNTVYVALKRVEEGGGGGGDGSFF